MTDKINHKPYLLTDQVSKFYEHKNGTPTKYVCTTALDGSTQAWDIFYQKVRHPKFGNNYFGLAVGIEGKVFISNADKVESLVIDMIKTPTGLYYSRHRHDFVSSDGLAIDGGRAYTKVTGNPIPKVRSFQVVEGDLLEVEDEETG